MLSIPEKANLIRRFSHATMLRLMIREPGPQTPEGSWADVAMDQAFEELGSGSVVPFKFTTALLLYPGAGFAYDCHMAALQAAYSHIDAELQKYCRLNAVDPKMIEAMPAKGLLIVDLRTMVPREVRKNWNTSVSFFVNNAERPEPSFERVIKATNAAMLQRAGSVLLDMWRKGTSWQGAEQDKTLKLEDIDGKGLIIGGEN
jgi:hypothetical protein